MIQTETEMSNIKHKSSVLKRMCWSSIYWKIRLPTNGQSIDLIQSLKPNVLFSKDNSRTWRVLFAVFWSVFGDKVSHDLIQSKQFGTEFSDNRTNLASYRFKTII